MYQVISYWSGELLSREVFGDVATAQKIADELNRELSIDAVVRESDVLRPSNWLSVIGAPKGSAT